MKAGLDEDTLLALKVAFTYMPKAIEVTKYTYGDRYELVLEHIRLVRESLLIHGVDPDEVYAEIDPGNTPNSSY